MTADEIAAVRSSFIGSIDHFGASEGTEDTALYRIYHSHDDYLFFICYCYCYCYYGGKNRDNCHNYHSSYCIIITSTIVLINRNCY